MLLFGVDVEFRTRWVSACQGRCACVVGDSAQARRVRIPVVEYSGRSQHSAKRALERESPDSETRPDQSPRSESQRSGVRRPDRITRTTSRDPTTSFGGSESSDRA